MFVNISAYKFVTLDKLNTLQYELKYHGKMLGLKGTILLATEGINLMLAGTRQAIDAFKNYVETDPRLQQLPYKESFSNEIPFELLCVKVKPEIITMKSPEVSPLKLTGKHLAAEEFKAWMDEGKDFLLLDTRNQFEVDAGTFDKAVSLGIDKFSEFPEAIKQLAPGEKDKPVVMFCTGGVRCEKASAVMMNAGYKEVYQIDGGILAYFDKCGGAHYHGNCVVFDNRVALDTHLQEVDH